MAFLYAVEFFVLLAFVWMMVTQVIIPLGAGLPVFPIFRGWAGLNKDQAILNDGKARAEFESALERAQRELDTILNERRNGNGPKLQGEIDAESGQQQQPS